MEYSDYRIKDRPWEDYPVGSKALGLMGGHWVKTSKGWFFDDEKGRCVKLESFLSPGSIFNGMVCVPLVLNV